ncbi:MAG TPA: glycosyltransferase [Anaerolineae bacterium]|nr:glycosyltransferase [Anaerolineae bacterium]
MGRIKAIHQIMPGFLYGDALGNQAARIRDLLRAWGYESQIYAQFRDQRWADPGIDYQRYQGHADTVLVYHYSIASPLTEFVRHLPDRLVVYYHNVTPAEFLHGYNPEFAALLGQGREELPLLKSAPYALAASDYNRDELLALGFQNVQVLPYFVYLDELLASADSPAGQDIVKRYADGWVNWLFVGRLVPNKRQDDLIRAFNYYHRLVNPHSRLFLVGSDINAPGYRLELEIMAEAFGLSANVHLTGPVGLREGLGGYYRSATGFLCLSEHEGFCVPLLEAMAFDVPILAFKATGVPYTLGEAGLLIARKRYDIIGELMESVAHDGAVRRVLVARQRERLTAFAPQRVEASLREYIDSLS